MTKSNVQSQTIKEIRNRYDAFVMQGSVKKGLAFLNTLKNKPLTIQHFEGKIIRRFFRDSPHILINTRDLWVRKVLEVYHRYWIDVLSERIDKVVSEKQLFTDLANLCPHIKDSSDQDKIQKNIEREFRKRKLHFLGGITYPFRSCYLYGGRKKKVYTIELLHGRTVRVPVYLLSDFISYDWQGFGTFGRSRTGGWATSDALYCIKKGYDIESERFKVRYLMHEGQHFDDYHRFKSLGPNATKIDWPKGEDGPLWRSSTLEFRAKLVELLNLSDSFLPGIIVAASNNPTVPHAYASFKIVMGLSELLSVEPAKLLEVPDSIVKEAALTLFDENTRELKKLQQ